MDRFGGPDVLTLRTLPVPALDPSEVLIAIDTAGVGPWDADMRAGWSPSGRAQFPLVLGTDGAGIIAAVGPRVRRFQPGDLVYSYSFDNPKGGFYAEYVAVDADKGRPHAGGPRSAKSRSDRYHRSHCHPGNRRCAGSEKMQGVIIHGASGGVGTLAVQFAKLRGARPRDRLGRGWRAAGSASGSRRGG